MSLEIIVYVVVQLLLLGFAKIEFKVGSKSRGNFLVVTSIVFTVIGFILVSLQR